MRTPIKHGGLQVDEWPRFQRVTWWVERIGWALFALFIVAALLGIFGTGPLGMGRAEGPGFTVQYERFGRQNALSRIEVHFAGRVGSERTQIWLSQDFIRGIQIEQVVPQPDQSSSSGDWVVYSLATQPGVSGTFRIDFVHLTHWEIPILVGLSPTQTVRLSEFIYP